MENIQLKPTSVFHYFADNAQGSKQRLLVGDEDIAFHGLAPHVGLGISSKRLDISRNACAQREVESAINNTRKPIER